MSLVVATQMDPLETIQIEGDSTFALLLEAQKRGHSLYYYTPENLMMRDGEVSAWMQAVTVRDLLDDHFTAGEREQVSLEKPDIILLRQDPPFGMNYITSTHLLERVHPKTFVVNNPASVRNAPEKILVTEFPDLMPPTLVTRNPDTIRDFYKEFGDIILKPLYGNGGAGVFRIRPDDKNLSALLELFEQTYPEPYQVQKYLPQIREGDKRIILVDGEIAGAINRIPTKDETRSNMHVGGQPAPVKLTQRDREICERLKPVLKEQDLIFTGIDIIGDYITEINVTSPTGLREIERFYDKNIASQIWDVIERKTV